MEFLSDNTVPSTDQAGMVPTAWLAQLEQSASGDSTEARQALFDQVFSDERRDQALASASRNRLGQPVAYYRYMSRVILLDLLRQGELTAIDHHPEPDGPVPELLLASYLLNIADYAGSSIEADDRYDSIEDLARSGVLDPVLSTALLEANGNLTYRRILPILDAHVDEDMCLADRSSASYIEFSPFLSASVGGPIIDDFPDSVVYVEMTIPDAEITPNPEGFPEEQEVLLTRLQRSWITRVHDSVSDLQRRVTQNPNSAVGSYYGPGVSDPAARWARVVPIDDLLPVSLV